MATVRPARKGPMLRQRSSWKSFESNCWGKARVGSSAISKLHFKRQARITGFSLEQVRINQEGLRVDVMASKVKIRHRRRRREKCEYAERSSYHAQAYASTRGSAPALSTPVLESRTIPPFEPRIHGP